MGVGPDLGNEIVKWSGFVEGEDGFLYGIPNRSNKLLRFDPIEHTATLIPLEDKLHGFNKWWVQLYGLSKWVGGVRAQDGFIYLIPHFADQILEISPLQFRP